LLFFIDVCDAGCLGALSKALSAVFPLIKFYTEQIFILVRMRLPNHVRRHTNSEAFQALQRLCDIYIRY